MREDKESKFGTALRPAMPKKEFMDPFMTYSNLSMPTDFYDAMQLSLYLAIRNQEYVGATRRTVSHFITDFEFIGRRGDDKSRRELKDYLSDGLGLLEVMQIAGMEQFIYGNSFLRIHYPFDRFLLDRRNGYKEVSLGVFEGDIKFNLNKMTYSVPDPLTRHLATKDRKRVDLEFADRKSKDTSRIKVRNIDPTRIMINMNFISGTCDYIYRFEEFFRSAVERGEPIHQINETPIDMLRAIRDKQDFAFNRDSIMHLKNTFVTGLSQNGWGIPNILLNYSTIHQMEVLRCINEAVGRDYMLPMRLISPSGSIGSAGGDVASSMNLAMWQSSMQKIIAEKRKDPTAMHSVPFPVSYQEIGAGGRSLAPVELMQFSKDEILSGVGYPVELAKMSLQTQQVPTAIRLFESTFIHLFRDYNNTVRWVTKNILNYMEREQIDIRLRRPSVADDMEKKHIWLQLASGGEVSRATAYRPFNIEDPLQEVERRAKEDIEVQKIQQRIQKDFEREATVGSANQVVEQMMQNQGPPPDQGGGGAPPPQGGGGGGGNPMPPPGDVTPLDIESQGEEMAQKWLSIEDVGERRKDMMQVKATNPTLYAVAQRKMEDMRQQGASQGRKSVGKQ